MLSASKKFLASMTDSHLCALHSAELPMGGWEGDVRQEGMHLPSLTSRSSGKSRIEYLNLPRQLFLLEGAHLAFQRLDSRLTSLRISFCPPTLLALADLFQTLVERDFSLLVRSSKIPSPPAPSKASTITIAFTLSFGATPDPSYLHNVHRVIRLLRRAVLCHRYIQFPLLPKHD